MRSKGWERRNRLKRVDDTGIARSRTKVCRRLARSNNDGRKKRVLSGRERNGGRVVYFKFFQTLGRTRRERKKASVAKGRWGVGRKGGGKEEEKGKKGKKGQSPGERYRGGNRGKRGRKKGRRESRARCSSFEPLDKFYIYSGWKLVESRSFLSSPLSSLIN